MYYFDVPDIWLFILHLNLSVAGLFSKSYNDGLGLQCNFRTYNCRERAQVTEHFFFNDVHVIGFHMATLYCITCFDTQHRLTYSSWFSNIQVSLSNLFLEKGQALEPNLRGFEHHIHIHYCTNNTYFFQIYMSLSQTKICILLATPSLPSFSSWPLS